MVSSATATLSRTAPAGPDGAVAVAVVAGAVLRTRQAASLRSGADPVHAFLDGYHTGLLVTIVLMAAGVVVSYLTLRPRPGVSTEPITGPTAEITVAAELEAIGDTRI